MRQSPVLVLTISAGRRSFEADRQPCCARRFDIDAQPNSIIFRRQLDHHPTLAAPSTSDTVSVAAIVQGG